MILARKNCLKCHFCTKSFRNGDNESPFTLNSNEREKARVNNFDFVIGHYYLACWKGQWSEALNGANKDAIRHSLRTKRCRFYYPHTKGNGKYFPAIEKEIAEERTLITNRIARWSFLFAAISLLISLFANLDKIKQILGQFL